MSRSPLVSLKIFHAIFSALGMAPCELQISTARSSQPTLKFINSRTGCIYNFVLLIYIAFTVCYLIPNYVTEGLGSLEEKIAKSALATMGNTSAFIIIIYNAIYQREFVKIGNQLCKFDAKIDLPWTNETFQQLINVSWITLLWLGVLITEGFNDFNVWHFLIHVPNSIVCCWLVLQYSLAGKALQMRFQILNRLFSEVDAAAGPLESLRNLRATRNFLWKTTRGLSKFYSLTILFAIGNLCFDTVIGVYYSIAQVLNSSGTKISMDAINGFFWTCVQICPIIYLSIAIKRLMKEVCILCQSVGIFPRIFLYDEINEFSLELFHKQIPFTAYGFFSLDCSLLFSIVSTLVTYEIIAVKFDPPDTEDITPTFSGH
ncbi:putative gustatory receptor 2a [Diachasma alloeum]|uniref:Gustatory receptor n=1 Tax=Diachasma alloeum TaxID=454923 RepID=A0A4E0RYT7_9HYME|nr:putative gustatory receptor 2a [Diachasma alloeum]THK32921.1 gustatory receptor 39 [Diachasma alloeum]